MEVSMEMCIVVGKTMEIGMVVMSLELELDNRLVMLAMGIIFFP